MQTQETAERISRAIKISRETSSNTAKRGNRFERKISTRTRIESDLRKPGTGFYFLKPIPYQEKTVTELCSILPEEKLIFLAEFIYKMIESHPKFEEPVWDNKSTVYQIITYLSNQMNSIFDEQEVRITFEDKDRLKKLSLHVYAEHQPGYGCIASADFLMHLRKRNRHFYELILDYFAFMSHKLHIGMWDEDQYDFIIDDWIWQYEEECEDPEEKKYFGKITRHYRNTAASYMQRVRSRHPKTGQLKKRIENYNPRNPILQETKEWMLSGFKLSHSKYKYGDFFDFRDIINDEYGDDLMYPDEPVGFVWCRSDQVFEMYCSWIDDKWNNCGSHPFTYKRTFRTPPKNWNSVKMPRWIFNLMDFMEKAIDITDKLNDYYKKS